MIINIGFYIGTGLDLYSHLANMAFLINKSVRLFFIFLSDRKATSLSPAIRPLIGNTNMENYQFFLIRSDSLNIKMVPCSNINRSITKP